MAITNYLNLITSEHKTKPNYMAWVATSLGFVNDSSLITSSIISAFDIDNAIGIQLDTIGLILGVSRTVNFQPSDGSSPLLDDVTYRLILKSRIVRNSWDGTIPSLQMLFNTIFPQYQPIIKDNKNMSVNIAILGPSTVLQQQLISNGYIMPRPMGVALNYVFSSNLIFGYDLVNSTFAGYDSGYWLSM